MNANATGNPKAVIREEWAEASPFWQKWNKKFVFQTQAATDLVVTGSQVGPGMRVLDLASGTGEPALSLAQAVGPNGRVVATDLVPEMLDFARQNADGRALTNMEFRIADAEHLPFADGEFDRVTCRFGIMFFPDIQRAMQEMRRVLKSGGRVCVAVFGSPEENPIFQVTMGPFAKRVNLPPPPPDSPNIYRFADETKLANVFVSAGFRDASTKKHKVIFPWPGPPEESWAATRELAAPFKKMIEAATPSQREEAEREILEGLRRFQSGQQLNLPATVSIATAIA